MQTDATRIIKKKKKYEIKIKLTQHFIQIKVYFINIKHSLSSMYITNAFQIYELHTKVFSSMLFIYQYKISP